REVIVIPDVVVSGRNIELERRRDGSAKHRQPTRVPGREAPGMKCETDLDLNLDLSTDGVDMVVRELDLRTGRQEDAQILRINHRVLADFVEVRQGASWEPLRGPGSQAWPGILVRPTFCCLAFVNLHLDV